MKFHKGDKVTNSLKSGVYTIKSFNKTTGIDGTPLKRDTVEYEEGGYDWLDSIIMIKPIGQLQFAFMNE